MEPFIIRPTHPILEPTQGRILRSLPDRALLTNSGSAISARTIETILPSPLATMELAWSRVIILPVTIVGFVIPGVTTLLGIISTPSGSSEGAINL